MKSLIKSLRLLGNRLPLYLTTIFIMTAMSALFEVAGSLFVETVVNMAEKGICNLYIRNIWLTIILGTAAIALASVFMCIYNDEAKRITVKVKVMLFEKAMRLPYSYYEEHHSGEIMARIIYDSDKATSIFSARLRRVLAPIISVAVFAVAMVFINPIMTGILMVFNVILLATDTLLAVPVKKTGKKLSHKNSEMTAEISNIISGALVTRIYDNNHSGTKKYERLNGEYEAIQKEKMYLTSLLETQNTGFDLMCSVVFIMLGIVLVKQNMATMGEVAAIYSLYEVLSFRFLQLGKNMPELVNCIGYAESIFDFLKLPEENVEGCESPSARAHGAKAVVFENIVFGYGDKEKLFDGQTYSFEKNKITAIVGQSGCGKSTLAKLLLGFYRLQGGDIYVLAKSVRNTEISAIRDLVAYVPQQPYLFDMSIMDNIRLGKENAADEEIFEAVRMANAHDFIEKMADGYYTVLKNRGSNLSGGERQRIALARAILKDAPIILMDEATSALDNESEQKIADAIGRLKNSRTVIMIAHRATTIQLADDVVEC